MSLPIFPYRPDQSPFVIWQGSCMGCFTDSGGVIVSQPFFVGNDLTITAPVGATQLQLGLNDNFYSDNTGFWRYTVNAGTLTTVPATAAPWLVSANPGYPFSNSFTSSPIVFTVTAGTSVVIHYVTGTCSLHSGNFPFDGMGLVGLKAGTETPAIWSISYPVLNRKAPVRGAGWSVFSSQKFNTFIHKAANGSSFMLPQQANPQWEFELTYDIILDQVGNIVSGNAPYTDLQVLKGFFTDVKAAGGEFVFLPDDGNVVGQALAAPDGNHNTELVHTIGGLPAPYSGVGGTIPITESVQEINNILPSIYVNGVLQSTDSWQLMYPNTIGNYPGFVIQFDNVISGNITANFIKYYRCAFTQDMQELENFIGYLYGLNILKFEQVMLGVVPQLITIGANGPWDTNVNPAFNFNDGGAAGPVSLQVKPGQNVAATYLSGLISLALGPGGYPYTDGRGDPGSFGGSASGWPGHFVVPALVNTPIGSCISAWADATGVIVGDPFWMANGGNFIVPPGAAQMFFGINDGTNNYGAVKGTWTYKVIVS